ncbi:hypothetical protein, partial [Methylobacterium sp. CCH5-D2]|uniref:hypothetical protein n=1 Tax=Methylobacterium sp. CCH5-D2 TaxID=1768765 RepID=UPI001AEC92AF
LDGGRRDVGDDREDHRRHQAHDLPVGAHEGCLHRFQWRDYVVRDVNAGVQVWLPRRRFKVPRATARPGSRRP